MKYSDLTWRYFDAVPCSGTLDGEDVLRGSAGDREQGCWVQFSVRLRTATEVEQARFLAFGCPHTIAVAAWVAEQALGRVLSAPLPEPPASLMARFEVPTEKLGRLLTIEDAWRALLDRPA